jgi:arylformamidase
VDDTVEASLPDLAGLSIDEEYNPRLRVANPAELFARWKTRAEDARAQRRFTADLRYGAAAAETLDFFPASRPGSPLLVFVHGGYWRAFDKSDFSWIAPAYVEADAAVAVVNYGLAPVTPIEEIVRQIARACAWLYQHASELAIDRERIVCAGHSAGGHLTAMMLLTRWRQLHGGLPQRLLAGAVCVSGLFDLRPLVETEFLKADLRLDQVRARRLSPVFETPTAATPCVLAVGALESNEFRRQTRLLHAAWGTATIRSTFEVPAADHFTVCDAFVTRGSALFDATCALLRGES